MVAKSLYKSPAGAMAVMAQYDAWLARWPVSHETLHIPTRHGDTFVIASGEEAAPPLVLLHGAGTNSSMWAADVAKYSRKHRVYAVDMLGEAGKSAPNRPAWNGPAYAEWVKDVLDTLHVSQATFIGVSQGGWTALRFATLYPARTRKLVLLSPGGIMPDRLSFVLRAIPWSLMGQQGAERIVKSLLGDVSAPAEVYEYACLTTRHFKARVGVLPIFTDEELRRLSMPLLLLAGACDPLRPSERIITRMQRLLAHVSAVLIPKAGHILLNATAHIMPFLAATEMQSGQDIGRQDVGRYGAFVALGQSGNEGGVDQLMSALEAREDLATLKLVDFSLGLVNTPQGGGRIRHYLLNGSQRQRNYAALYFKRRGNTLVLSDALTRGLIDQSQASAE